MRAGVRYKIDRAKKHLDELVGEIQAFAQLNPYDVVVQDNPQTGQREHRVGRADPLPADLPLIAGDVVHNLRSALDHLVGDLLVANGRDPESDEFARAAFTIWKSKAAYEAGFPGEAKGISEAALEIYARLKPYKGGNDALWRLHKLDVVDKHRLLLTIAAANQGVTFDFAKIGRRMRASGLGLGLAADYDSVPLTYGVKNPVIAEIGAVLMHGPLGDQHYDDVKFTFEVTLNEPTVLVGEPLIPALQQLVDTVEHVVALFDSSDAHQPAALP